MNIVLVGRQVGGASVSPASHGYSVATIQSDQAWGHKAIAVMATSSASRNMRMALSHASGGTRAMFSRTCTTRDTVSHFQRCTMPRNGKSNGRPRSWQSAEPSEHRGNLRSRGV